MLSDRLRTFTREGCVYAHTSAVPLSYLSLSDGLLGLLRRFALPGRPSDLLQGPLGAADERFFSMLVRAGVLLDADAPDPVHSLRGNPDATRSLYLYPTSSCNLSCVYCHATSGPSAGPRLSLEHAVIAVDDFFATLDGGTRAVRLKFHGGGEPTTNFGVMEGAWKRFHRHAEKRGLPAAACLITNGAFGPSVLRVLSEPQWRVEVSYDGPRQGVQRPTASNRDSRERVVANLRALRDAGKLLATRATLTRDGLSSMRALVDDAAQIGVRRVQVEPASCVGRGARLLDGSPDPAAFAETFLDAFRHALGKGVRLTTSAWSHARVGDGRYCGAVTGARALTPDGFVSACPEACDGKDPDDPFIVGRLDVPGRRLEILPARERALGGRVGYDLPLCRQCHLVDTCAGGCPSKARAQSGDVFVRDERHCVTSLLVNSSLMADLADGRLLPDPGWQPMEACLEESESNLPGAWGRLVALVPPFARSRWNADPERRPFLPAPRGASPFFDLGEGRS